MAAEQTVPVAPSLSPTLDRLSLPRARTRVDKRVALIAACAVVLAIAAALVAQLLAALIAFVTNLAFHHRLSITPTAPGAHGPWVIVVPVLGAIVVGLMARYGAKAIRGHGIPEAMEQIAENESRIPLRMTFLKPLSAAISIGTGGPFGAEGPIIATGGALGSVLGQSIRVTVDERKTLLSAGAAAGMAATFGTPVSAVLLAIELLLFEYRARSVIPVALAASTATAVRIAFVGSAPVFPLPEVILPSGSALAVYVAIGAVIGVCSVAITRLLYAIEDGFERLPIHWMWWPALGAVVVGVVGFFAPRTLGVGYDNIEQTLRGEIAGTALLILGLAKLVSWSIALGSGTSGGTLAPLFTIGGALGALLGGLAQRMLPGLGIDPRIGALVGMAAMFAGASHALLASVVFAFETTRQPMGLLPLLGGCAAAYFVSCASMPNSIMTERLARRGVRILGEYAADHLDALHVEDHATAELVTLSADTTVAEARRVLEGSTHQGFPIVDGRGQLVGVLTRRDLLDPARDGALRIVTLVSREPVVVHPEHSLREAADHMVEAGVGRVIVVSSEAPRVPIGILTRSDLLTAHRKRLAAQSSVQSSRWQRAR